MTRDTNATEIKLNSQSPQQINHGLKFEVCIKESMINTNGPPVINITAENLLQTQQTVRANNSPPAPSLESKESNPRIVLIPTGKSSIDPNPVPIEEGCWQLATPVGEVLYYSTGKISPRDKITRDFSVWGAVDNQIPCLPTGEFTFKGNYEHSVDEKETEFEWGFKIQIE